MTPPTLPGEVWRDDTDGPVCVTTVDKRTRAWFWDDRGESPQWKSADGGDPLPVAVYRAWALSLRADAQRVAEQMRERCAQEMANIAPLAFVHTLTAAIRALPIADPSPPPIRSAPRDRGRP